jgi:hypothetical protein
MCLYMINKCIGRGMGSDTIIQSLLQSYKLYIFVILFVRTNMQNVFIENVTDGKIKIVPVIIMKFKMRAITSHLRIQPLS